MKNAVIAYWSLSGNTELMAKAIAEGVADAGATVTVERVEYIDHTEVLEFDVIILGCPAMTTEILEEQEFKPFFTFLRPYLNNRYVALFGSYDWSDEYMARWEAMVLENGGTLLAGKGLTISGRPNEEGLVACREFGQKIVKEVQ